MESSSPRQTFTLASILDAERVVPPQRAQVLLASLAQASAIPDGPVTVREWSEAIIVERAPGGAESAVFVGAGAPSSAAERAGRHMEALRAAAVAMLWGRESAQGPDGLPRYPRLRRLLVDQWEDTRRICDGPEKLMMFFDSTLALDRAAEPKAGREGFKSLSLPSTPAAKKDVQVGTIGRPFEAIADTGHFRKDAPSAPAEREAAAPSVEGRWLTPQVSTVVQSSAPPPPSRSPEPVRSSRPAIIAIAIVLVVLGAAAFVFLR
jgi:hypothetical protein